MGSELIKNNSDPIFCLLENNELRPPETSPIAPLLLLEEVAGGEGAFFLAGGFIIEKFFIKALLCP